MLNIVTNILEELGKMVCSSFFSTGSCSCCQPSSVTVRNPSLGKLDEIAANDTDSAASVESDPSISTTQNPTTLPSSITVPSPSIAPVLHSSSTQRFITISASQILTSEVITPVAASYSVSSNPYSLTFSSLRNSITSEAINGYFLDSRNYTYDSGDISERKMNFELYALLSIAIAKHVVLFTRSKYSQDDYEYVVLDPSQAQDQFQPTEVAATGRNIHTKAILMITHQSNIIPNPSFDEWLYARNTQQSWSASLLEMTANAKSLVQMHGNSRNVVSSISPSAINGPNSFQISHKAPNVLLPQCDIADGGSIYYESAFQHHLSSITDNACHTTTPIALEATSLLPGDDAISQPPPQASFCDKVYIAPETFESNARASPSNSSTPGLSSVARTDIMAFKENHKFDPHDTGNRNSLRQDNDQDFDSQSNEIKLLSEVCIIYIYFPTKQTIIDGFSRAP